LYSKLKKYINDVWEFKGVDYGEQLLDGLVTKQRVIFAIPPNATAAQKRALDRAVEYGNRADINVEVIIKVVK